MIRVSLCTRDSEALYASLPLPHCLTKISMRNTTSQFPSRCLQSVSYPCQPTIVRLTPLQGKSDGPLDAAFSKKARTSSILCDEATLTQEQLDELSTDESKAAIVTLQKALHDSHNGVQKSRALAETTGNRGPPTQDSTWTAEKVAERAEKVRDICHKEIKKQMKWQPSCKQGTTKWSYTGVVPNAEVFNKVFEIEEGAKAWKQKKISTSEFGSIFGRITASVSPECRICLAG